MKVANASLLDEATACAEAMTLCYRASNGKRAGFLADERLHPQNLALLKTRAGPLGLSVSVLPAVDMPDALAKGGAAVSGIILQYPNTDGAILDHSALIHAAHSHGASRLAFPALPFRHRAQDW